MQYFKAVRIIDNKRAITALHRVLLKLQLTLHQVIYVIIGPRQKDWLVCRVRAGYDVSCKHKFQAKEYL